MTARIWGKYFPQIVNIYHRNHVFGTASHVDHHTGHPAAWFINENNDHHRGSNELDRLFEMHITGQTTFGIPIYHIYIYQTRVLVTPGVAGFCTND